MLWVSGSTSTNVTVTPRDHVNICQSTSKCKPAAGNKPANFASHLPRHQMWSLSYTLGFILDEIAYASSQSLALDKAVVGGRLRLILISSRSTVHQSWDKFFHLIDRKLGKTQINSPGSALCQGPVINALLRNLSYLQWNLNSIDVGQMFEIAFEIRFIFNRSQSCCYLGF